MKVQLDPRIDPMFRGRPPHEQFLAAAMCAILASIPSDERGPKNTMIEKVLVSFAAKDIDWTEVVAGKPMLHWNGKHRGQVEKEVGKPGADAVDAALKARGMALTPDPKAPKPVARPAAVKTATPTQTESEPELGPESLVSVDEPAETSEPTFAGHPLSELAPKSDADLLKIEGVSKATIKEIRAAANK